MHQNHDFLKEPHEWKNGSYVPAETVTAPAADETTDTEKPAETATRAEAAAEAKTEPQCE